MWILNKCSHAWCKLFFGRIQRLTVCCSVRLSHCPAKSNFILPYVHLWLPPTLARARKLCFFLSFHPLNRRLQLASTSTHTYLAVFGDADTQKVTVHELQKSQTLLNTFNVYHCWPLTEATTVCLFSLHQLNQCIGLWHNSSHFCCCLFFFI